MQIDNRLIGPGHPPYVIAEIGVNHDGSVQRALELVDEAARAGADAAKLQMFSARMLLSRAARLAAYQRGAGESNPVSMLERLELSPGDFRTVIDRAHERGMHAIVTVFSLELVASARSMAWDAFKTASPDIVNKPLLETLSADGRPLIVSTGAATREEVSRATGWLGPREEVALMQCVSAYPTPEALASTGAIGDLEELTGLPVGYSDHTQSIETGARAVEHGAVLLEKHLTHNQDAIGPDHAASLEPQMMRRYIELARAAHRAGRRGSEPKRVLDIERDVREVSRQSLTATRPLRAGHVLQRSDLTLKRPGSGIPPCQLEQVIGAVLAVDVGEDDQLPLTAIEANASAV